MQKTAEIVKNLLIIQQVMLVLHGRKLEVLKDIVLELMTYLEKEFLNFLLLLLIKLKKMRYKLLFNGVQNN